MNKVKSIHDLGQSIWLDFFDKEIMTNGKLQTLIDKDGLALCIRTHNHNVLYLYPSTGLSRQWMAIV
ncbi:MAG: hypothetical protein M3Z26_10495 [Bacteroidota bacterium]|nr:hypothetical protein [Bacteroidota bacterium]